MTTTSSSKPNTNYVTVEAAAASLLAEPSTVRAWIRRGLLPATKIGRRYAVPVTGITRMQTFDTSLLLAQLRYGQDERADAGSPDLEGQAKEAAQRAKARSVVANARLRQAQGKDLAALDAKTPPTAHIPTDVLPTIRELNPMRVALIVRELGSKPVNAMTDAEIFELKNRLDMVTAIPAVDATSGNQDSTAALAALREQGGSLLDSGTPAPPAKPYTPVTWSI